ncbi:MAG: hypothetical protein ABIK37_00140 [candidate division WOR-3 bacterium]
MNAIKRAVFPLGVVLALLCACEDAGSPATGNRKPRSPVVTGPSEALVGERLEFSVLAFDPDGDRLRVFVAWGDGDTSDYGEFVLSGAEVVFEHCYRVSGVFGVSARCHDLEPKFSDWSSPRAVTVTRP